MKLGVISDTHGNFESWQKALSFFTDVEFILHGGDILAPGPLNPISPGYQPRKLLEALNTSPKPIIAVKGNCDAEVDEKFLKFPLVSPFNLFQYHSVRLFLTHGHLYGEEEVVKLVQEYRVQLFISGHTHCPKVVELENALWLNPGSPTIPLSSPKIFSIAYVYLTPERVKVEVLDIHEGKPKIKKELKFKGK
jgi:hypothetical protein